MFDKRHCSPSKRDIEVSCLSKKLLIKIAKILNKEYKANIKIKKSSKKKLFDEISNKINGNKCNKESCWITIDKISSKLTNSEIKEIKQHFRPFQPKEWGKNPNTWLTTTDINQVMKQYEIKYPYFKYYGATPIDFNLKFGNTCMVSEICKIDLEKLKDKKCIGMVFNTDPHNKSGQHWFSMYIDVTGINNVNPSIYYFDSATPVKKLEDIPMQILKLIETLQIQSDSMFDIFFNDIQHQYGDTECGVYCLHFLTEMLKGINFKKYKSGKLTDKKIEKYRDIFFIKTED